MAVNYNRVHDKVENLNGCGVSTADSLRLNEEMSEMIRCPLPQPKLLYINEYHTLVQTHNSAACALCSITLQNCCKT